MAPSYLPKKKFKLTDEPYSIGKEQKSIEEENGSGNGEDLVEEDVTFEKVMKGVFVEKLRSMEVSKDERRRKF